MPGILLIQTASIGDVILITPVLEKLHQFFPGEPLDVLVKKGNESLFAGHPYLRQVWVWDKSSFKYRHLLRLVFSIRKLRYSKVINFQRFAASGLLTVLSGAAYKAGFDKNPLSFLFSKKVRHRLFPESDIHESVRNLELVTDFTDADACKPALYPSNADEKAVKHYKSDPYICIAPASLWYTKQFPAEKWIDFIDHLPQDYQVYLLGSAGDAELCQKIVSGTINKHVVCLAGKLSMLESAALMREAVMNYVNDSAPLHLASSVNAPVTAIFCSTIPEFGFGPLSEKSFIVQAPVRLACKPCGLHGHKDCPEKHFQCAMLITNNQLLNSIGT